MKIIEKITESIFFKTLIEKINDLIGNSNECKMALDSIDIQVDSLKSDLTNFSLGVHTDGCIYIFHNGEPIGSGVSLPIVGTGDDNGDSGISTDGTGTITT